MFETNRLNLRRPKIEDLDVFFELENDPEVYRHLPPGRPFDRKTVEERLHTYIDKKQIHGPLGFWVADSKSNGEFIAYGLLIQVDSGDFRLGYVVRKQYWGQGYATELTNALVDIGKANGLQTIKAVTSLDNKASSRVLEKVGLQFEARIPGETPEIELNLYQISFSSVSKEKI